MKTHQRILDQLLDDKFKEIVSVNYEQTGTGIIYEKVVMVSYSTIWKKKYKKISTLFLLAPEKNSRCSWNSKIVCWLIELQCFSHNATGWPNHRPSCFVEFGSTIYPHSKNKS